MRDGGNCAESSTTTRDGGLQIARLASAVLGVASFASCHAAVTRPRPGAASTETLEAWMLGEAHRGRAAGRSELGLLVMSAGGQSQTRLTGCDAHITDALPTGLQPDQYFFIIEGHLHLGLARPGDVPVRIDTEPAGIELAALGAVSRSRSPTVLLALVWRDHTTQLWEFEVRGRRALGAPASARARFESFAVFRDRFRVDRCDADGRRCLATTRRRATGTVTVSASENGPLTGQEPMFELSDCNDAVRGWWSLTGDGRVYLLASCRCARPRAGPASAASAAKRRHDETRTP